MNIFTVSFFGHRYVECGTEIENRLDKCKQYNKTYRNPPKGMYRNSPISVQDLARKCTSKPIMI